MALHKNHQPLRPKERIVKQVARSLVKKGEGPVAVNLRKNPRLRDWVQRTSGVKPS